MADSFKFIKLVIPFHKIQFTSLFWNLSTVTMLLLTVRQQAINIMQTLSGRSTLCGLNNLSDRHSISKGNIYVLNISIKFGISQASNNLFHTTFLFGV